MRTIAIGDIHGCYDLLMSLMDQIRFVPSEDVLIFLGDYIDRGSDSGRVVQYLRQLKRDHRSSVILLMGNHEDMCYRSYRAEGLQERILWRQIWDNNGGEETRDSLNRLDMGIDELLAFIDELQLYHETESFTFVHAGLPNNTHPRDALSPEDPEQGILWLRNAWFYEGKSVVVGHSAHKEVTHYKCATVVDTGAYCNGLLCGYDPYNQVTYRVQRLQTNDRRSRL